METVSLDQALGQFTGTMDYYLHWTRRLTHTDGVQYLAEHAGTHGAHWLVDAIASYQCSLQITQSQELRQFQIWELTVHPDRSADLVCRADTGRPPAIRQHIESTDFTLDSIKLFVCEGGPDNTHVLMLPSEY